MTKKILSILLALIMVLAMAPVSVFASYTTITQTEAELPERTIKSVELPFAWDSVVGYTFDGKYAVFLTIDSVTATLNDEFKELNGWDVYFHVINYTLYYTEDLVDFKTTELTVDTSRYSEIEHSSSLYSPLANWTTPEEIPYCYEYEITNIGNDKYFINVSAWGDATEVCSFGVVFSNGEASLMSPEIHGNIFVCYDDCCILINSIMDAEVSDFDLISVESEEISTSGYKHYNLTVSPIYYYSEDFESWTKIVGGAEEKISRGTYNDLETGGYIDTGYFVCEVETNNVLTVRYRPEHPQMMMSLADFGNVNVTYNGKDFICLEKKYNAENPVTFWENNGYVYGVNQVYISETNDFGYTNVKEYDYTNITNYDSDGNTINERKLDFESDRWYSATTFDDVSFSYIVSLKNNNGEFQKTFIYSINENSEIEVVESDIDVTDIIGVTSMGTADSEIIISLFADALYLQDMTETTTIYKAAVSKEYSDIEVWNSKVILFADGVYTVSEPVINAILAGETPPADEPVQDVPTELTPNADSNITVTDTVANAAPEMSIDAIKNSVKNENVQILDKDGKEIAADEFVGTGAKILVLDNEGNILTQYEVMVKSDVDGNGKITPADARLALRAAAGLDTIEGVYETAANFDGQDVISPSDARMILRKAAGLE